MSYNDVIPWSGFAMSPWGRSGGIAPFDQLFERRESFPKGFSFWGREMAETAYVYELVDKETGKWYVGSRTARNCHPLDLGVNYFTSSKVVGPLFRSNPDRFEKKIIVVSDCDYVVKVEASILNMRDAKNDPMPFNMRNSGKEFNPSKGGKLGGARNVASGHIEKIRSEHMPSNLKAMRSRLTPESLSRAGTLAGAIAKSSGQIYELQKKTASAGGKATSKMLNSSRIKCLECGMVSNTGALGRHQKATGHIGKEKINVQS